MTNLNHYIDQSQSLAASFASKELSNVLAKAQSELKKTQTPHRRVEDWKYTNIDSLIENNFQYSISTTKENNTFDHKDFYVIKFIDGKLTTNLPAGLSVKEIKDATDDEIQLINEDNYFDQDFLNILGKAFINKGYIFKTQTKATFDKPLLFLYDNTQENSHISLNNFFYIAKSSKLSVVEVYSARAKAFLNIKTNSKLENNSKFIHTVIQDHHDQGLCGININSHLSKDSHYNHCIINTGSLVSRSNLYVNLFEENATADAHGLYQLKNKQHHDTMSFIRHNSPHTYSHQLYKGVMDDNSRGVFTGKVRVEKDAQLINAEQLNKNLLLTNKAHANSRPQMEIYADDVKCAHGSTTGQMSEAELFYFESRGIKPEKARAILANAFTNDVILKINDLIVQNFVQEHLANKKTGTTKWF